MAGIGLESDSSPAAVRPLGVRVDTSTFIGGSGDERPSEEAGIQVAEGDVEGDELNDEIEYVPREEPLTEGAQHQGLDDEMARGNEEEILCEPCGEVKANTWRSPVKQMQAEVDDHNLTRCPYRSWCDVCVEAMGREWTTTSTGRKRR